MYPKVNNLYPKRIQMYPFLDTFCKTIIVMVYDVLLILIYKSYGKDGNKKVIFYDQKYKKYNENRLICILIVYYISIIYMVKSKKNLTYKKKHNNSKKRKSMFKKRTTNKRNKRNKIKNKSMKQKGGMETGTPYGLIPAFLYIGYLAATGKLKKIFGSDENANKNSSEKSSKNLSKNSSKNPSENSSENSSKKSSENSSENQNNIGKIDK